ncbi:MULTISPECIES: hypothetical protein [Chryseobacterium]|uniref:hypothetical protein n=1 Tax=Chryseobacterium TaxID=59732 RepID=UPI0012979856|nr:MULTISPECIES: hypothetical protein [Chryseobacterium]MDR6922313.1 hypothetical protein [Chryseobacterium sp. 2987]
MMRDFFEMIFKRNEDAAKMHIWSLVLLLSFAVFSVLVYATNPSFNSLIVYLTAFAAYLGFGLIFISSLAGKINYSSRMNKGRNL